MKLKTGQSAPNFKLESTDGSVFELDKQKKKNIILYFYPKDDTPGCTLESKDFSKLNSMINKKNTVVFGVSKDSIESHLKFKSKFKFPFELLSDENIKLIKELGAWGEKSMYGKKFMGIKRTTVLIGKNQKVIKIWNNVKVKDHVKTVLDFIKTFN